MVSTTQSITCRRQSSRPFAGRGPRPRPDVRVRQAYFTAGGGPRVLSVAGCSSVVGTEAGSRPRAYARGSPGGLKAPDHPEQRPDAAGERADDQTIPAEKTVDGMGDVVVGGESEEDAPDGG